MNQFLKILCLSVQSHWNSLFTSDYSDFFSCSFAQVLPAATVAGLAMQALTGTPSPPFLDFQPALIPSISQSNSSSHGERGEGSSEWTCNNWRLEVRMRSLSEYLVGFCHFGTLYSFSCTNVLARM
jgi:hypothetical protein